MRAPSLNRSEFLAVLLALIAALFTRAWLQVELGDSGFNRTTAANLSYLVVPPFLLLFLFPLLRGRRQFFLSLLQPSTLNRRVCLRAISVGVLLRMFAWCQLVAGVAFGWISSDNPNAIVGPAFSFQCRSAEFVALGILVMACLVPLIEEVTSRALVISYLKRHGAILSVLISAIVFALLHPISNFMFTLIAGIVFAVQYWGSGSLWPSLISHVVVNTLIQLDWYCLNGQWNPQADSLPLLIPGIVAAIVGLGCLVGVAVLIDIKALGKSMPAEG